MDIDFGLNLLIYSSIGIVVVVLLALINHYWSGSKTIRQEKVGIKPFDGKEERYARDVFARADYERMKEILAQQQGD